uniref:Uncharacterized protein n=1 Tax=Tanacetum cinerariifolium TaxID=118510 RepID=A0A699KH89_TANCI|nr:hypothetical protein [Tanacetum cinerariifolium]
MDEANLTMEEYIKLEAEKARRRGKTFIWETTAYDKVRYHEDIDYFKEFKTDFPDIVFDDAVPLTTRSHLNPPDAITFFILRIYMCRLAFLSTPSGFIRMVFARGNLECQGLTEEMKQSLIDRLRMVYTRAEG